MHCAILNPEATIDAGREAPHSLLLLLGVFVAVAFTLASAASSNDDLYEILGVSSDASNIEIKRAYKKKALIHHPDKQTSSSPQAAKRAADKMQKINQAYETLSDPHKRKLYDQFGTDNEQEVQRQQQQQQQRQQYHDPYDPWGFRQRQLIRSRTLKISTELFEDILQGSAGTWLLLLLSEYNCQQCVDIAPAWDKASKQLHGILHTGRVIIDGRNMRSQMHRINLRIQSVPAIILISSHNHAALMPMPSSVEPQNIVQFVHSGLRNDIKKLHANQAADQLRASKSRHQSVALLVSKASQATVPLVFKAVCRQQPDVLCLHALGSDGRAIFTEWGIGDSWSEELTGTTSLICLRPDGHVTLRVDLQREGLRNEVLLCSQHLLPQLAPDTLSASCLPTAADVAAGFGDRICVFAVVDEGAYDVQKDVPEHSAQQQQQQLHQHQLLLRRFAAKVAASHRFLRFLSFKSQDHKDFMRWLSRGVSAASEQSQEQEPHKQKQRQQQTYRLFAADFASRKSIEIPSPIVASFFGGDSQQLLQHIIGKRDRICQWFDGKGLDMDGAENTLPLPKLGHHGVLAWLQSFVGDVEFSVSNVAMAALFGLWFFIKAM